MNKIVQSKRIEKSTALLAVVVSGTWAASAGAQTQVTNPIAIPNEPYHVAVGDLDDDGLFDVVVSHNADNVVRVWQALDENNFALVESFVVPEAAGVLVADLDADGTMDIAFGSYADSSVTIAYGIGDFSFVVDNDNSFIVDVSPSFLSTINHCGWIYPDLLVANSPEGTIMHVAGLTYDPVVTLVTKSFELADCDSGILGPCNNYTEPNCNPNTAGQGIQECMRAAKCRGDICLWAACIEYEDGGFLRGPLLVGQTLACTAVFILEEVACLPSEVLP